MARSLRRKNPLRTKFSNKAKLSRVLKQMPREVRKEAEDALKVGAEQITNTMDRLVVVDDGELKASIRHFDTSNYKRISRRISAGGKEAPYARIVEFAYHKSFFWPAFRVNRRSVRSRLTRNIRKAHKRISDRNGGVLK